MTRLTYKDVAALVKILKHKNIYPVGSFIRKQPCPKDLDIVTTMKIPELLKFINKTIPIDKVLRQGTKMLAIQIHLNGHPFKIDFWHGTPAQLPYLWLGYAYPRNFQIGLRRKAKSMGYKLSQYDFKDNYGRKIHVKNFRRPIEIFEALGIPYRTPQAEFKKLKSEGRLKGCGCADCGLLGNGLHCAECIKRGGIDFLYLPKKAFQLAANAYRKRFCNGKARPLEYNEISYGCHSFTGPGTRIDKYRDYPPYNNIDACSRLHDIAYSEADKEKDKKKKADIIRKADIEAIKCYDKYPNENGYLAAKLGINGKMKLEDVFPIVLRSIAPNYSGRGIKKYS